MTPLLTLILAATSSDASVFVLVSTRQTSEASTRVRHSGFTGGSALEVALVSELRRWKVPLRLVQKGPECRIQRSTKIGEALQAIQQCNTAFALIGEMHAHQRHMPGMPRKKDGASQIQNVQLTLQLIHLSDQRVVSAISRKMALPGSDYQAVSIDTSNRIARLAGPDVAKDLFQFLGRPLPTALRAFLKARQKEALRRSRLRTREKAERQRRVARHKQVLKACEADEAAACAKAAFHQRSGFGTYKDAARALEYQSRACALGHRPSCEQAPVPAAK